MKPPKKPTKNKAGGKQSRQELTLIGNMLPGFESLAPTLQQVKQSKSPTPQARHHFNRLKQMEALHQVAEANDPDMGFMHRLLTLCSLPRTDPGERLQYKRQNGPYKLIMIAGGDNKLPYGNLPRLLLAWVCTEAVQTGNPRIVLGKSLSAFMQKLGMQSDSGGEKSDSGRLKTQVNRLFNCQIQLIYDTEEVTKTKAPYPISEESEFWWNYKNPQQMTLMKSWIELGQKLFNEIIENPIPIDMNILKKMRRSSLGLDIYLWLSYKTYRLYKHSKKPERLSWEQLYVQFGPNPAQAGDKDTVQNFRKDVLRELRKLKLAWPALEYATPKGCLEVRPCMPSIPPKSLSN